MKKTISLLLSGVLLAASIGTVHAASPSDFSDMPDDWSTPALTAAIDNGLLSGSDGKILPKDYLTRAQMATIIVRAFGAVSETSMSSFKDVPQDSWYYSFMQKAVAMKVFTGDGSGYLTPEANITREQVFVVLSRAFDLTATGGTACLDKFTDKGDIAAWAAPYAAALVEKGYVNGSNGCLYPKNNITRAEFAQIMYNIVSAYIGDGQTVNSEYDGCVIVRGANVTFTETAKVSGTLVVGESSSNVRVVDKTRIAAIVDTKNSVLYGKAPVTSGDDGKTDSDKKDDDIFWVIPGGDTGTSDPGNDDDGWSNIYRP